MDTELQKLFSTFIGLNQIQANKPSHLIKLIYANSCEYCDEFGHNDQVCKRQLDQNKTYIAKDKQPDSKTNSIDLSDPVVSAQLSGELTQIYDMKQIETKEHKWMITEEELANNLKEIKSQNAELKMLVAHSYLTSCDKMMDYIVKAMWDKLWTPASATRGKFLILNESEKSKYIAILQEWRDMIAEIRIKTLDPCECDKYIKFMDKMIQFIRNMIKYDKRTVTIHLYDRIAFYNEMNYNQFNINYGYYLPYLEDTDEYFYNIIKDVVGVGK